MLQPTPFEQMYEKNPATVGVNEEIVGLMRELVDNHAVDASPIDYVTWVIEAESGEITPTEERENPRLRSNASIGVIRVETLPGHSTYASRMGLPYGPFPVVKKQARQYGPADTLFTEDISIVGVHSEIPRATDVATSSELLCSIINNRLWLPGNRELTIGEGNFILSALHAIRRYYL